MRAAFVVRAAATPPPPKVLEKDGSAIRVRYEWHCTMPPLTLGQNARPPWLGVAGFARQKLVSQRAAPEFACGAQRARQAIATFWSQGQLLSPLN
jgi:hypothetical protein